jgi:hypothetical protein
MGEMNDNMYFDFTYVYNFANGGEKNDNFFGTT